MEFKINDLSLSEREIEISCKYEEIKRELEIEVKKQIKDIQIPGFRKGKVPLSILKKMFGNSLEMEAAEKIANQKFYDLADNKDIHPIGVPSITDFNFKPEADLFFKVKYEVIPSIDVKNYTDINIEVPDYIANDEDVERDLNYILRSNSTQIDVDEIGDDNNYIIDAELTRIDENGEVYKDAKPEKLQLDLTNENLQAEIKTNAKNKKVGETFSFSFSDTFSKKDDEGKEIQNTETFKYLVLIKGIKKIILPELTEEFIKTISKDKVSNVEDLKNDIRKDIQEYYDERKESILIQKLFSEIIKNNDFQPPKSVVNSILDDLVKEEEKKFNKQGYGKFDKTEASKRLLSTAEFETKWFLISKAIKEKENIVLTDDDISKLAEKDAEKTGIPVEKLLNYYKSSKVAEKLVDKKLIEFLKEKNNIIKVKPEEYSQNLTKENL